MLTVDSYLIGGSPAGTTAYLNTINQASTQCPSTKIVLGGYSQGGQILHNAAVKLTAAVTARIAAGKMILFLLFIVPGAATVKRAVES